MDIQTTKKFYRSRTDKVIAGVCGGLGEYFNTDPVIFRILFLVLLLAQGAGFWIYIVLAIFIPKTPKDGVVYQSNDRIKEFAEDVRQGAHNLAQDIRGRDDKDWLRSRRNVIGLIIVLIGVGILLNNILPFHLFRWDLFWPLILIVIGLAIIARSR